MAYFIVYKDVAGNFRWRLKADNHEVVATGEGYLSKQGAINSANWVKTKASNAPIYDQS